MNQFHQHSIQNNPDSWDHLKWLKEFSGSRNFSELRAAVFAHTVFLVKNRGYVVKGSDRVMQALGGKA